MRTRTALTSLALATGAAIALTGCGPSGGSGGPLDPDADVTITWWTGQADEAEAILEDLAAEFEADHPNVTIDVSPGASTTDDLLQKISAGFVGGTYPDISYAYGSWAGELGESGRTLDITDRIAEPAVGWDELPQVGRDTATPGWTTPPTTGRGISSGRPRSSSPTPRRAPTGSPIPSTAARTPPGISGRCCGSSAERS
jgi:multiple sugar transport system substrate-binding protein